jgi:hypothetical protein
MHNAIVTAWPPARDVLRKNIPASEEPVTEKVMQDIEVPTIERLKLQYFLHVSEPEWKLPVAEINDLHGDFGIENLPAFQLQLHWVVFVILVVFVKWVHLGIGRRQFLVHQILWLDGFIQEVKNSSMYGGF